MAQQKRDLEYQTFDEVIHDLGVLLEHGYTPTGEWNLSQVCGHLQQWMTFPMDGFPKPRFPINLLLWLMKVSIAKRELQTILTKGFRSGTPTMPQTVPKRDESADSTAVDTLKQTIERFRSFSGEVHPSPLFGQMDLDTVQRLQLRHCAHHLGFLLPKDERGNKTHET